MLSSLPSDSTKHEDIATFEDNLPKEDIGQVSVQGIISVVDDPSNTRTSTFDLLTKTELGIDPTRFYAAPSPKIAPSITKNIEFFQVFHRQDSAFVHFDEIVGRRSLDDNASSPLKVYSFESVKSGQRKFLVADYSTFFKRYLPTLPNKIDGQLKSSSSASFNTLSSEFNTRGTEDDSRMQEKAHTHVYEIIRDNVPCRAYFDLEYERAYNADVDGDDLTSIWINLVVWKIFELYDIILGKKDIIVLDSSTPKKYSKHVVLIIPVCKCLKNIDSLVLNSVSLPSPGNECDSADGVSTSEEYLFRSNITVGSLVCLIIGDITGNEENDLPPSYGDVLNNTELESEFMNAAKSTDNCDGKMKSIPIDSDVQHEPHLHRGSLTDVNMPPNGITQGYEKLWVNKDNGKVTCFVDLGVYTRNRAFRLWNSSKFGKNVPFQVLFQDRKKYLGLSNSIMKSEKDKIIDSLGSTRRRKLNSLEEIQDFTLKRSFVIPYNLYEGIPCKKKYFSSSDNNDNCNSNSSSRGSNRIGVGTVGVPISSLGDSTGSNQNSDVIMVSKDQQNSDVIMVLKDQQNSDVIMVPKDQQNSDVIMVPKDQQNRSSIDTTTTSSTYVHTEVNMDNLDGFVDDVVAGRNKSSEHSKKCPGDMTMGYLQQSEVMTASTSASASTSRAIITASPPDSYHSIDINATLCHVTDTSPTQALNYKQNLDLNLSNSFDDTFSLLHSPSPASFSQHLPQSRSTKIDYSSPQFTHSQPYSLPIPLTSELDIFDSPEASMKYTQYLHLPIISRITSVAIQKNSDGHLHFQTQSNNLNDDPLFWRKNEILRSTMHGEKSPFYQIDDFVLKFVSRGGVQGLIGKWIIV